MVIRLCIFLSFLARVLAAESAGYNMPDAVTTTMAADAVMTKMETAVKPADLAAFQQQHPATFWLFGEDRQLPVRNHIIPAHWFGGGARQYQKFSGLAQPGEFYVFQVCMLSKEPVPKLDCIIQWEAGNQAEARVISNPTANAQELSKEANSSLTIFWIGVQIPIEAKGTYRGTVCFRPTAEEGEKVAALYAEKLQFSLQVQGAPLADGGTSEAWRMARLKWLDSTIGESDTVVTRPFTPLRIDTKSRTIDLIGRRITLGRNGIPAQFTSYFSASNTKILEQGRDAWADAPRMDCLIGGQAVTWKAGEIEWLQQSPTTARWRVVNQSEQVLCTVTGVLEFDGNLQLSMQLSSRQGSVSVDDVRFELPWNNEAARYAMGLGLQGGICPPQHQWNWDVSKHQDAVWMGDVNVGAMLRFKGKNFQRPLINAYYDFRPLSLPESWGKGGISWVKKASATVLRAFSGPQELTPTTSSDGALAFDIDWYFTPFKPLDAKKHFSDRYYHAKQGAPVEDPAQLRKEGATIMEIHHNRLCNPYINYPYNDDSLGRLTEFVKKAHQEKMRVAIYYTTRELTQNIPEFFALKSMGGEIILPRRPGVKWPVTNSSGPHPWLLEHVGDDIVPAWRENLHFPEYKEKLDLAVITTPDSRWNDFYLEGLNFLVNKVGIDGLYIDDTALDRKSMQRARRILDADGNTSRRVSMHSWNHFNGLAKWSNSSIAFMELYPYYDGLWHGEGFSASSSPEFMLVEMSGIPYGLFSEMLDHPHPWHGMVFGMRKRWPWSGDPRAQWQLEQQFGIEDSEFIGWWDTACPVKSSHPDCKVSVFQKSGKTLIAIGSWAQQKIDLSLAIDWKDLGISPQRASLWQPACAGLQEEFVYALDRPISIAANHGAFLILDETPRPIKMPEPMQDPAKGLQVLSEQGDFLLEVPANSSKTQDLPWVKGSSVAMAKIDPQKDAGQSWGVGIAVGWSGGRYLQINARTDGRWGIRKNGAEMLEGKQTPHVPAVVAIRLTPKFVQMLAQQGDGEWELIKEFPRGDFPGEPETVRYGKIGQQWQGGAHSDRGALGACRVEWLKLYGAQP